MKKQVGLVKAGETPITGLAWIAPLDLKLVSAVKLLASKEGHIVACCEGVELLDVPLNNLPLFPHIMPRSGKADWWELAYPLPLERTRFDIPAWATLKLRLGNTQNT